MHMGPVCMQSNYLKFYGQQLVILVSSTMNDDGDDQKRLEQKTDIALQEGNGGIQGALKLVQNGVENAGFHGYCHPPGVIP